ncbi:2-hydroxychromene-2-carboxylate isomerase [Stappia sp. F7233]|uniref:2-hydroxychromene-2-carboxylate isomerase n=1 Tax=Stappia albiluteola TaxID=2758565 RepID=A0A839AJ99_9HYPH|nr:2-hydroxychromene-2-carboxylate isomerase [Stappia albiluteola]MBA5779146.1 2-hydroxychromene-2-carboxylate isomerase [Stappia albiluteola]
MQRVIDYYYSHPSPWAYMGHRAFLDLAEAHNYAVRFKPVNLGQVFAETGGLPLGQRHAVRQAYRFLELQRWRDKRDLPLNLRPAFFPVDAGPSDRAAIALALEGGPVGLFSERVLRSVWAEERNVADREVLTSILTDLGQDAARILDLSEKTEIADRYAAHQQEAVDAGVFGSPSYVWKGEVFWGQDRLELLADALASDRAAYTAD